MRAWRVARVLILLLWVAGAAMTWWTHPRQVDYERALDAAQSGEVTAHRWGRTWNDGSDRWFETPYLTGGEGPWFAWRAADHRVYWTDTAVARDGAERITRELGPPSGELIPWRGWLQGISLVLALTFLVVLVTGPAPALGTRWYWFWVVVLIPYAIGMVFWVLRDRPWTAAAAAAGGEGEGRDRGWFGLVTAIVANFVIAILTLVAGSLLS
ncbi:hypothetical protein [Actinoplanes sp. NPDC023714]|uniref:hypothetical protein n=1 Tax=Actinoplanes sp. NPDC023714 TaxID=3154322 RepID=UPI0033C197B3